MTLIRRWALVACSALLCLSYSVSINAQTAGSIDPTTGLPVQVTGNQLSAGGWTGQSRTGAINGANPRDSLGCCTGSGAYVDTSNGGAIYFSYSNTTVSQGVNINNALANAGSGLRVSGVNYDFQYYNQDYNRGTLSSTLTVTGTGGGSVTRQHSTTTGGWTDYSNTLPLQGAQLSALGTATLSFTGRDDRFWAGYYGPAVRNPHMTFAYTVDPCAANPAYSSTCAGFSSVTTTANQVPNPNGYATGWDNINNSFAINKGLEMAGSGLKVHGWQWGYQANANGPYCNAWNFLGICLFGQYVTPSVTTNVNITSNTGASIYSVQRNYTDSYNTTSYQYLLPSSRLLSTLGNFNFTATTNDQAYIGSMWARTMYTPDQCMLNPLSSNTCPGYAKAYHDQQCSISPLFASDCPGYTEAYKTQQCSLNPLYASDCPGYAAAYLSQQCSQNPLYSSQCSGYGQAMLAKLPTTSTTTTTTPTTTAATTTTTETTPTTTAVTTSPTTTTAVTTSPTPTATSSSTIDTAQTQATATAPTTTSPTQTQATTTATTVTPTANNPQPKVGEVTTAGSQSTASKSSSAVSTSQVLSMISSQQSQQRQLEMSTAQSAVEQAKQESAKTTNDAQTVAATQQAQTLANAQDITNKETARAQANGSGQAGTQTQLSGVGINLFGNQFGAGNLSNNQRSLSLYSLVNPQSSQSFGIALNTYTPSANTLARPQREEVRSFEQSSSFDSRSAFNPNNPLNTAMTPPVITPPLAPAPTGPSVNAKVKDNDAAGGVSLASIAKQPQGFELYMGGMVDRPFYAPKEIYKGQRVVDNARAQRMLNGASDRLHQEMVDMQYNKGN